MNRCDSLDSSASFMLHSSSNYLFLYKLALVLVAPSLFGITVQAKNLGCRFSPLQRLYCSVISNYQAFGQAESMASLLLPCLLHTGW